MTDAILVEQRIEPGRTERARALFEEIGRMKRTDAAIEVLKKEGVYTESAFLQRTDEDDFVLYYIEAEDGEEVYEVYSDVIDDPDEKAEGLVEIVTEFEAVMAEEPSVADVEFLYHLVNPERP